MSTGHSSGREIVASTLKGNPRQAKRFLNTFITKRQLSKIYYGDEIDISILAKLLVLQKLDNDLFIQLNEWNKEFDTENKEFKEIRTKVMEGNVDAQNPWNTSQIKKWLECKPVELEKYRLEKYFYLTRENLKRSSIDESGFSKNTKEILERIGRAKSGQMVAIIKDMEKLRAEEIADTFKVVVSKIEKGEMKFFVVRDLFLNFDAYKGKIVDAIGKSTVPIKAGDMAALRTMYNSDTGNMNTVLETMVKRGTLRNMSELKPRITENGIDYILVGDYYIPDLKLPEEHRPIGKYGRLHREYLREVHPARLNTLTLTGELWTYLADLNEQAQKRLGTIIEQMKAAEGVTEELKSICQMEWVQRCNNIHNRAEEIVLHEMIYS